MRVLEINTSSCNRPSCIAFRASTSALRVRGCTCTWRQARLPQHVERREEAMLKLTSMALEQSLNLQRSLVSTPVCKLARARQRPTLLKAEACCRAHLMCARLQLFVQAFLASAKPSCFQNRAHTSTACWKIITVRLQVISRPHSLAACLPA